jgi:hypothetical protein
MVHCIRKFFRENPDKNIADFLNILLIILVMGIKKNSKGTDNLTSKPDLDQISYDPMKGSLKDSQDLKEEENNEKEKKDYDFYSITHTEYKPLKRVEQILIEAMESSKDGFEAISKTLNEVSEQKLCFLQALIARSERVNKIVLEELCALEMSYHSLPHSLKELNKYNEE